MRSTRKTPAMGWNTWNSLRNSPTEAEVVAAADAIVDSGMRDVGYEYVVVDDCWQAPRRNDAGHLAADPVRFPSGMAALGDEIRKRGLKFGMYLTPGRRTCAQIWDGYGGSAGLGSFGREAEDLAQYVDWGVEYLKYDWCQASVRGTGLTHWAAFALMSRLVDEVEPEIVYSISEYGVTQPWEWAPAIANSWRTTRDITAKWGSALALARKTQHHSQVVRPGAFNDADMLEVGNGDLVGAAGWSHLAMWAMLASPLMAGNKLWQMSDETRDILCDRLLVSINQDPLASAGRIVRKYYGADVWHRRLQDGEAILLVNTRRGSREFDLKRFVPEVDSTWQVATHEGEGSVSAKITLPGRGSALFYR